MSRGDQLRRLIERSMEDCLFFSLDANETVRYASPSCKAILGQEPEQIVGRPWRDIIPATPEMLHQFAVDQTQLISQTVTCEIPRADGGIRQLEITCQADVDKSGQLVGIEGIIKDVTRRKESDRNDPESAGNKKLNLPRVSQRTETRESADRVLHDHVAEGETTTAVLRDSEEHFRQVAENIGEVFWLGSPDWSRIIYLSPTYEEVWGRAREDCYQSAFEWLSAVLPEDREILSTMIANRDAEDTSPVHFPDYRIRRPDGSIRWIAARAFPIVDGNGRVYRIAGIAADVTRRKQYEGALDQLSAEVSGHVGVRFFETLVERLAVTVGADVTFIAEVADPKCSTARTISIYVDGKIAENCEYQLAQTPCLEVIEHQEVRVYPSGASHLFPNATVLQELKIEGYIGIPLRDTRGNPLGVTVAASRKPLEDVRFIESAIKIFSTRIAAELERLQKEKDLRESEEQVRLLLDSTAEAIYGLDIDGNCTFCNPSCVRMLGYKSADDLLGRNMHQLIHHTHADGSPYPIETCQIYEAFRHGNTVHVEDEVLWRADGCSFPVEYWSYPIQRDGHVVGAVMTFLDVTERKQYEEAIYSTISGISTRFGSEFFEGLVTRLAQAIDADYAFIGELTGEDNRTVRTIALCVDGQISDNIDYALDGTPCENVIGESVCSYPQGVCDLFPKDRLLVDMEANGYVGVPLWTSDHKPLGIMAALTRKPLEKARFAESIIQMFATRTSAEIERLRKEESLRESEERLRIALDAADLGTWLWRAESDQDTRDAGLNRILGLDAVESTQPCTDFFERVHGDDKKATIAEFDRAIHDRDSYLAEFRIVRPNGEVRWVRDQGKPFHDETGKLDYVAGAVLDITEHRQAEDALKSSEERLRAIFEKSPVGIALISSATGSFIQVNQKYLEICGYSETELLDLSIHKVTHPDDLPDVLEQMDRMFSGEIDVLNMDKRSYRKDGSVVWLNLTCVPLFRTKEEGRRSHIAIINDITQRKQAKDELETARALLEAAFDASPAGMIIADAPDGRLRLVNAAAFGIRGDTNAQLTDIPASEYQPNWQAFHPDGTPFEAEEMPIMRSLTTGEVVRDCEIIIRRDGGEDRCVLVHSAPVRDADGKIVAGVVVFPDITERKRVEEELKEHREHLEEIVRERTDELERENTVRRQAEQQLTVYAERLKQSNVELERFAYVASHDLQEPLRAVSGFCELLKRRYGGQLGDDADQWIDFAVDGAARMQALIQDLLAYSRLQTATKPFAPTDLNDVLKQAMLDLVAPIAETNARVTAQDLPTVLGDAGQLKQVLQNLLGNAIKFRGEDPPAIQISAEPDEEDWTISIKDNGIGIDPEYRQRVFQIFKRLHTHDQYAGTGIGLAVCQKVIERHGGRIWIESEADCGSLFRFTLPKLAE